MPASMSLAQPKYPIQQEESESGLDVEVDEERGPQEDEPMEASTSSATAARVPGSSGRARRKGSAAGKPVRNGGVRAYGQQYGNELMQPEWMTDVPVDLGGNWWVRGPQDGGWETAGDSFVERAGEAWAVVQHTCCTSCNG